MSMVSEAWEKGMKKGIVMRLEVYIEGEDAPAHDFSQTGREVIFQVLRSGLQQVGEGYTVRLRTVEPLEGGSGEGADAEDFDPSLDLLGLPPPQSPSTP
jgi:hypothetical protein